MNKYKALVSFCGTPVSMKMGEIREIADSAVVADLIKAGYIVSVEQPVEETAKPVKKAVKGKKNEA